MNHLKAFIDLKCSTGNHAWNYSNNSQTYEN